MLITKICPYCKRTFTTQINSRKFCKNSCARLDSYRRRRKRNATRLKASKRYMCQWCGKIFAAARKRSFCCDECRRSYCDARGTIRKTTTLVPVKITLADVSKASKNKGISYGKYVVLKKLK